MGGVKFEPRGYQQLELGLNYRLTDQQAALSTSQILGWIFSFLGDANWLINMIKR